MCGIAGIWRYKDAVDHEEIRTFTDSMFHRGPDGAGYEVFESDNLALGHRRLSILDLSQAGKQPMPYAGGRYWLTFNGEIYNFIELRDDLKAMGYKFMSDSDSEVVLAAYTKWGKECFKKFNGMWAMAIWDSSEKELLICRDRFGVKPLHFLNLADQVFAFASETSAFKYLKGYKRNYDRQNLLRAMHSHNAIEPAGETIYQGIRQLMPGSYMVIKKTGKVEHHYWWKTLEHLPKVPTNFESQKEEFFSLFFDACKIRLRSDVPVASALSGGVDSTAVYCMLARVMQNNGDGRVPNDWQRAFSMAFPGSIVDERKYIESVLDQTQGKGIIIEAGHEDLVKELEFSTRMADFISGTPLSCLTYVYKAMHQYGIVVSMDGHGVDEYLYGYQSSVILALANAYVHNNYSYAKTIENTLMEMHFPGNGQLAISKAREKSEQIIQAKQIRGVKLKRMVNSIFPRVFRKKYSIARFEMSDFFNGDSVDGISYSHVNSIYDYNENLGEQCLLEEFHYKDLPYNLRDFDRGAMQHQIEIRMPFLDYRLVTFTMALPQQSKLNNGYTKYILRESMKGIMPEDIRTRKLKIGLGAPLEDWFNGPLNVYLMDISLSEKLKNTEFLNSELIKRTIQNNCTKKAWTSTTALSIWPILNYLLLEEN